MAQRRTIEPPAQEHLPEDYRLLTRSFSLKLSAENKSPRTQQTYAESLRLFGEFLEAKGMPTHMGGIRREHIEAFVSHLLENYKPATASNRGRRAAARRDH